MATSQEPTPHMLLFRNTGPELFAGLTVDERQGLLMRWNAWFDGLLATGEAVDGRPLEPEMRVVSGPGGERVVDGPFPEAKEAIGGYVLLMVGGLEEATAIAQRHPALPYGLMIEVRRFIDVCHLGVSAPRGRPKALGTV